VEWLKSEGKADFAVTYRIRDWLIRPPALLGTPIPVVYCDVDGIVPVPNDQLPVRLPEHVDYQGSGENPLRRDAAFLNTVCPRCGGPATRETDTMDTFMDSSWYWFRYLSPRSPPRPSNAPSSIAGRPSTSTRVARSTRSCTCSMPVSPRRCPTVVSWASREPSGALSTGPGLGADGEADEQEPRQRGGPGALRRALRAPTRSRLYLMFMGPWDQGGPWSPSWDRRRRAVHRAGSGPWRSIHTGPSRVTQPRARCPPARMPRTAERTIRGAAHRTLATVTGNYEGLPFNTMVAG